MLHCNVRIERYTLANGKRLMAVGHEAYCKER